MVTVVEMGGAEGMGGKEAGRINTENTETVGPLAHPKTEQIVRTSHLSLNLFTLLG